MKIKKYHPWDVSPEEARKIQQRLSGKVLLKSGLNSVKDVHLVAGCDVGYDRTRGLACGCVVLLRFPHMELVEMEFFTGQEKKMFPYIPGLLAFREGPILLKALSKLKSVPDVVIFDGQGIAHSLRMGLASHLGILLSLPTIGCAKSLLYGVCKEPANLEGAYTFLKDEHGQVIGVCLRTKANQKPIFVSQGYKIDLKQAWEIVLTCCLRSKIPEPLRLAHLGAASVLSGLP